MDWGEIYAHVAVSTGWTWDYILHNMDLPRLESLNRYWASHPPLQILLAAFLGVEPPAKNQKDNLDELMAAFPQSPPF